MIKIVALGHFLWNVRQKTLKKHVEYSIITTI